VCQHGALIIMCPLGCDCTAGACAPCTGNLCDEGAQCERQACIVSWLVLLDITHCKSARLMSSAMTQCRMFGKSAPDNISTDDPCLPLALCVQTCRLLGPT
jgi:hypothetical protein